MSQITRTLAEFVAGLDPARLPPAVSERARMLILDHVGIALRARNEADISGPMAAALAALDLAGGAATVIGDRAGYAPPAAALFNGNLGHALDFDDTHAPGSLHSGAPIIPAAFAAAQMAGACGRDVVAGVVAGFEVQTRLSLALDPTAHYDRGFHPTATCGVFGAAAAAARVLGLDADRVVSAFGLCGSQAAGSMQFLADGAWNKPYHTGYAAMNGLVSATMARAGFRGTAQPIEGAKGFLRAYAPSPSPEKAIEGLGEVWQTLAIAVKPYPSCRYSHAAIDALVALKAANDIAWSDVESVEIGVPRTGWKIIGDPEPAKHAPSNYVDGQFSMPFCAAVALREGGLIWDHYRAHLGDADTLALCRKVHTVVDPRAEAEFPRNMSGVATIRTAHGRFEQLVVVPKGEPDNFLSGAELRAKFDGLVSPWLDERRRGELAAALLALDAEDDVSRVLALTRPAADARLAAAGE